MPGALLLSTLVGCARADVDTGRAPATVVFHSLPGTEPALEALLPDLEEAESVEVATRYTGSGETVASVLAGEDCDVALFSTPVAGRLLLDRGFAPLPPEPLPVWTTIVLAVRPGNPLSLTWEDLGRGDVALVVPDRTRSVGARWIAGALVAAARADGRSTAAADAWARGVLARAASTEGDTAEALARFLDGEGDAVLAWAHDVSGVSELEVLPSPAPLQVRPELLVVASGGGPPPAADALVRRLAHGEEAVAAWRAAGFRDTDDPAAVDLAEVGGWTHLWHLAEGFTADEPAEGVAVVRR